MTNWVKEYLVSETYPKKFVKIRDDLFLQRKDIIEVNKEIHEWEALSRKVNTSEFLEEYIMNIQDDDNIHIKEALADIYIELLSRQ